MPENRYINVTAESSVLQLLQLLRQNSRKKGKKQLAGVMTKDRRGESLTEHVTDIQRSMPYHLMTAEGGD